MPPMAAKVGKDACALLDNAPSKSSRLTSRPISIKNSAISPSLIQWINVLSISKLPTRTCISVSRKPWYIPDKGEFAKIIASTTAIINRMPPADSWLRKFLIARSILRSIKSQCNECSRLLSS